MKILLDSSALMAFSGNTKKDLENLGIKLRKNNVILCGTHIQLDEKYSTITGYNAKLSKLEKETVEKGIPFRLLSTKIVVEGVSKVDLSQIGTDMDSKMFDTLKNFITECEKNRKREVNVIRDAIIGLSSLKFDVLITGDRCLRKGLEFTLKKHRENMDNTPKIIRRTHNPKSIINEIENQFNQT